MRSSGALFCIASGAAFGAMAVFGKLAYDEGATVGTLLGVRFTLAAAMFWVLVPRARSARCRAATSAPASRSAPCGYALQAGCYFVALGRIEAPLLALLLYTFPAIVAVAAVALGRERFGSRHVIAVCLAARRPDARAGRRGRRRARPARRRARARRRASSTAPTSSSATAIAGRVRPQLLADARLHRRGGDAADRLDRCSASSAPAS